MAIFYTDTGSFSDLEISGSLLVSGSGSGIFTVSGSRGGLLSVSDLVAGSNVFQISSGSTPLFQIKENKEVHVSGSLIVTGSIIGGGLNFNVSAGTTSNNVSQLVFSNSNNVSFGLSSNSLTATADPGNAFTYSYFNPNDAYQQVVGVMGNNSLKFLPLQAPNVQFDRLAIPFYISYATNATVALTLSFYWGLYTRNSATLNLLTNYSTAFGSNITLSTTNASLYHGIRLITNGITRTLTEGQYYAGFMCRSTTAGSTANSISNIFVSQQNSTFSGIFGAATNATIQYTRGLGQYATTTANLPASVAFSQINGNSSAFLRQPMFYMVSQTF